MQAAQLLVEGKPGYLAVGKMADMQAAQLLVEGKPGCLVRGKLV